MRITSEQRQIIVATAKEVFGGDSVVRLFGSRVDDSKRGARKSLLNRVHRAECA